MSKNFNIAMSVIAVLAVAVVILSMTISEPHSQLRDENKVANESENGSMEVYTNNELGISFKQFANFPEPVLKPGQDYSDFDFEIKIANQSFWNLALGPIQKGACEGDDCYYLNFEAFPSQNPAPIIQSLKNDEMINIKSDKNVNGNRTVVYTEGGMCGYLHAIIFGEQRTIQFTSMCGADSQESMGEFYLILDSFKFTGRSKNDQSIDRTQWKSFRQENGTYQTNIPSGWLVENSAGDSCGSEQFMAEPNKIAISIVYGSAECGFPQPKQILERKSVIYDGEHAERQTIINEDGKRIVRLEFENKKMRIDLLDDTYLSVYDGILYGLDFPSTY
jgi:hypothetical protein